MTQQAKALYHLQAIDLGILRNNKRLTEIADQLANHSAVQAAQAQVDSTTGIVKPLQVQMRDLELQVQSTTDKQKQTEQRLYSGTVKNPKELQDMQHEIASLKKWHSELEDRMLNVMVGLEDAQANLETAENNLETVLADTAGENADLIAEKKSLEAELVNLHDQREAAIGTIDSEHLALYEEMRPQKGNRPLSQLTAEDSCSVCGIKQTGIVAKEIRRGDDLIKCINCKRILVYV